MQRLRQALIEVGLRPEDASRILKQDLEMQTSNFEALKSIMDQDTRQRSRLELLQRQLLLTAVANACS